MRRIFVPAVFLIAALSLAGCSAASNGAASIAGVPAPIAGDQLNANSASGSSDSITSDIIQRQVVTTGTVVIRTKNPITAADKAAHLAQDAGGRVDARNQAAATKTTTATATLKLRIPAAKLTDTLDELKKLGTVESIELKSDDVTTKSEDLGARITALSTSVTRLLALEAKAKTTADLIELENDISDRQGELESLTAQQRYLNDQVAMSTISLRLLAPHAPIVTKTPTPANAFTAGLASFGSFFTWVFLVLTYLVPWILLAAVIALATIWLVRRRRRRRRAVAGTTPTTP